MNLLLKINTKVGPFYIGQSNDGRFHPIYDNEGLGSYSQIWQATEDLATNSTYSVLHPKTGALLDTSQLGIPEDPNGWKGIS